MFPPRSLPTLSLFSRSQKQIKKAEAFASRLEKLFKRFEPSAFRSSLGRSSFQNSNSQAMVSGQKRSFGTPGGGQSSVTTSGSYAGIALESIRTSSNRKNLIRGASKQHADNYPEWGTVIDVTGQAVSENSLKDFQVQSTLDTLRTQLQGDVVGSSNPRKI